MGLSEGTGKFFDEGVNPTEAVFAGMGFPIIERVFNAVKYTLVFKPCEDLIVAFEAMLDFCR